MIGLSIRVFLIQNKEKALGQWAICSRRAGWDSNPRFAAPQAAVLVLARLPALRRATDSFPYNAIISTGSEIRLVTSGSRTVSYASEKGEMDSLACLQQVSETRIPDHSVVRE